MRYAVLIEGIVTNIVIWDGQAPWSPAHGGMAHAYPSGPISIGWVWIDGAPVAPDPAPEPEAPVPERVLAGQLIQALAEIDMLNAVDAAVAQADLLTQRLWGRASSFARHESMVEAIATAVGQTSDNLDDIFRLAATK